MTEKSAKQRKLDPCSFIVFGVTGDLTHRLVLPALYNLAAADLLPDKFCVVGVARKGMSGEELRDSLLKGLHQFATRPVDEAIAQRLLECVTGIEADPKEPVLGPQGSRRWIPLVEFHTAELDTILQQSCGRQARWPLPWATVSGLGKRR